MITVSEVLAGMLAGSSFQVHSRLTSWWDGEPISEDIPAVDVSETADATLRVPERLTFRVPVVDDRGLSWVPTRYDSPLGTYGQRIVAQVGVSVGSSNVEWLNRGTFLIESADKEGDAISVECLGLKQLLDEARFPNEYQPKTNATLGSILRALIEPGLTVDLDEAPTDRVAPSSITYSDNRLDNVHSVLDAWPAHAAVTSEGHFEVTDPLEDPELADVVFHLTDGAGGTAMQLNTSITRDGAINGVVARGQYPDSAGAKAGQEIVYTAYDNVQTSPYRIGGPFSPYLVPFEYASPLMTTAAMVQLAAKTRLRNLRRAASRTVKLTAVPHPALKLHDPVSLTSDRLALSDAVGRIEALGLPHDAGGGDMELTVRLVD